MVGPGHCPMTSKYGSSISKAVGPVDPSFLVVKKSHFNKNIHLTTSLRAPQNRKFMQVKHVLSSHSKDKTKILIINGSLTVKHVLSSHSKDKTKILIINGSLMELMKVESIAECSPWSILQYF